MSWSKSFSEIIDDVAAMYLIVFGTYMLAKGNNDIGYALITLGSGYLMGRTSPYSKFRRKSPIGDM